MLPSGLRTLDFGVFRVAFLPFKFSLGPAGLWTLDLPQWHGTCDMMMLPWQLHLYGTRIFEY